MKRSIPFFLLNVMAVMALAQPQIENSGFETWGNVGMANEEPLEWSSLKTTDGGSIINNLAPQVCWQSTDAHTGGYSVYLKTATAIIGAANGTLTCGRVHAELTPANGYVFTDQANTQWNHVITSRPDSMVGWYKANPQPGDHGKVEAILHTGDGKMPENGTLPNWVGHARWDATSSVIAAWTRFAVPFDYYNAGTPAYSRSVLTSGDSLLSLVNSESWYDDLALIYNLRATPSDAIAYVTAVDPFPMTVDYSTGGEPVGMVDFVTELSDVNGSFASPVNIGSVSSTSPTGTIPCMIPAGTLPGTDYRIRVNTTSSYYAPVDSGIVVELSTNLAAVNGPGVNILSADGQ